MFLSQDEREIWLEDPNEKTKDIIRIRAHNIDWSQWIRNDLTITYENSEKIRKNRRQKRLNVQNIYLSSFPPVDDLTEKDVRTDTITVNSWLVHDANREEQLLKFNNETGRKIPMKIIQEPTGQQVQALKEQSLFASQAKNDEERQLFNFGTPFFTYVLLAIQIVMFAVLELNGGSTNSETLVRFGAKFNPYILQGDWWRLIFPVFLHIGFTHLFMNSLALYFIGTAVERIFGSFRFILIYFFAGFAGGLASFVFSDNLSAGASGAIFGCFGALLYFGAIYPRLFFRTMGMNVLVVIGINLVFGFSSPGIDNAGHIGGLIGGFLMTGALHFPKQKKKILQFGFVTILVLSCFFFLNKGYTQGFSSNDAQTVNSIAQKSIEEKKYEQAVKVLNDFIHQGGSSAHTYFLLSYAEIKLGKTEEAFTNLKKSVEIDRNFHEAHYNLALLYLDQKDYKHSLNEVKKANQIQPDNKKYKDLIHQLDGMNE
jgi:rhomboid protease GluP